MFSKNEYVFHESAGVCIISDIRVAPLEGMPSDRNYYVLKPLLDANSVVYLPVDSDRVFLRRLLTREEAESLLSRIGEIQELEAENPKLLRAKYIETMHTYQPTEWVRVIKTVKKRASILAQKSQKLPETERSFLEKSKQHLCTELSVVLDCDVRDAEPLLEHYMNES